MALRAVVFDLDGVIRHYDRAIEADIERRWGLEPGRLLEIAYGGELGQDLMCGRISPDEFAHRLGVATGQPEAARELVAMNADLDHEMVALVASVRHRVPVALLTNGTLQTRAELAAHGLSNAFDHVFNSAEIGLAKPHAEVFEHMLGVLGCEPGEVLFVDDRPANVEGALAVGIHAHHFTGREALRVRLSEHGFGL